MTSHRRIDPYRIDSETAQRIENTFRHHPPFGNQLARYDCLRNEAKALAYLIVSVTPQSREQILALTRLEEAIFYANAAIARNEEPPVNGAQDFEFAGCYGGHNPDELPDSEEAGGDPVLRIQDPLEIPEGRVQ